MSDEAQSQAPAPASAPAPRRPHRLVSVLVVLALFGSGFVCGAACTVISVERQLRAALNDPNAAVERLLKLFARRLDLDPAQRTKVAVILRQRQTQLRRIRQVYQPAVEAELQAVADEIDAVLRPEQRRTWHRLVARLRRWRPALPEAQEPAADGPHG